MSDNYLVIRIHPDSPVDAGTFSNYLNNLTIDVYSLGAYPGPAGGPPPTPLGEAKIGDGAINLVQDPWNPSVYVASVSQQVAVGTQPTSTKNDFGTTLAVAHADGIAFASIPNCPADANMFPSGTTVT